MNYIVTGATGAIGREIAKGIAAKGDTPILACRSEKKGLQMAADIKNAFGIEPRLLIIDLSDSNSVKKAAAQLAGVRVDGIVNNAGVMNAELTHDADGHEDTVNVNYSNTRLLTELLLPKLKPGAAIVFTTSATRNWFPWQNLDKESIGPFGSYNRLWVYARSKKLITRYARELGKELKDREIRVNCADPGVVDTPMLKMNAWYDKLCDLLFRPFCLSPNSGAKAALRALYSNRTGRIFTSPFGSCSNKKWLSK